MGLSLRAQAHHSSIISAFFGAFELQMTSSTLYFIISWFLFCFLSWKKFWLKFFLTVAWNLNILSSISSESLWGKVWAVFWNGSCLGSLHQQFWTFLSCCKNAKCACHTIVTQTFSVFSAFWRLFEPVSLQSALLDIHSRWIGFRFQLLHLKKIFRESSWRQSPDGYKNKKEKRKSKKSSKNPWRFKLETSRSTIRSTTTWTTTLDLRTLDSLKI